MVLRQIRIQANMSQSQLAKAANVSRVSIARYESGSRTPDVAIARRIASVLHFDWTRFYDDPAEGSVPNE